jgi:hypothetical protein
MYGIKGDNFADQMSFMYQSLPETEADLKKETNNNQRYSN